MIEINFSTHNPPSSQRNLEIININSCGVTANKYGVSLGHVENVLELSNGDGGTTLWLYKSHWILKVKVDFIMWVWITYQIFFKLTSTISQLEIFNNIWSMTPSKPGSLLPVLLLVLEIQAPQCHLLVLLGPRRNIGGYFVVCWD